MAGCGVINETLTMNGTAQTAVSASAVCDFFIIIDPEAASAVTVTWTDELGTTHAADWFPGMGRQFYGVDLYKFSFNGSDTQKVTISGQSAAVR